MIGKNGGKNFDVRPPRQENFDREEEVNTVRMYVTLQLFYGRNPYLDSLKPVTQLTTVNEQYFADFLREVRWNSRRTSFIPRSVVLLFFEFGAEPPPRLTRTSTTKKQRAHRPHPTS